MGKKIVLSGVSLTDPSAEPLRDDPRLTAGSLILVDFTSALVAAGVPANGAAVPNIAWKEAAAVIGAGTEATLACSFLRTFATPYGAFERTSKGALHGAVSNSAQNSQYGRIEGPTTIKNWMRSHPTRELAWFVWTDVTRTAGSISNLYDFGWTNNESAATNYILLGQLANTTGLRRVAANPAGWTGAPASGVGNDGLFPFAWGNLTPFNGLNANDGRSAVLYMSHVIDVAASGKTFAELDALDAAAYASFFGAGGRYNGDTYTPPATLLAG